VKVGPGRNRPISVYRRGEMPIHSCGQSVSARRRKAGARLNAHTELRAKRQRSAREAIYQNRPIAQHVLRPICQTSFLSERIHPVMFGASSAGPYLKDSEARCLVCSVDRNVFERLRDMV